MINGNIVYLIQQIMFNLIQKCVLSIWQCQLWYQNNTVLKMFIKTNNLMRLTRASAQKILPFIQVDFSGSECFFFTASTFSPMTIRFPQKLNKNSFFINIVGSRWFFLSKIMITANHRIIMEAIKKISHLLINQWGTEKIKTEKRDRNNKNQIKFQNKNSIIIKSNESQQSRPQTFRISMDFLLKFDFYVIVIAACSAADFYNYERL